MRSTCSYRTIHVLTGWLLLLPAPCSVSSVVPVLLILSVIGCRSGVRETQTRSTRSRFLILLSSAPYVRTLGDTRRPNFDVDVNNNYYTTFHLQGFQSVKMLLGLCVDKQTEIDEKLITCHPLRN